VGRARYSASLLRAGMDKILSLLRNLPAGIAGGSRVVSPMAEFRAIKTREEWTGTIRFIDFRKNFDGTFEVPAVVNGVLKVDFLFDSGASEVTISSDLASVLARSGTIRSEDWLPAKTFLFADGSQASNPRFMARRMWRSPFRGPRKRRYCSDRT
jgi:hypothetical protein